MLYLGPVKTSKSINESFLQLADVFRLAKKYGFKSIILAESHAKSWISFLRLSKEYNIKPVILYKHQDIYYLLHNENDLIECLKYINKLKDDIKLNKIELKIPEIIFPVSIFRKYYSQFQGLSIKECLNEKIQKELGVFDNIDTDYELSSLNLSIPKLGGYEILKESLLKNKYNEAELERIKKELYVIKKLDVSDYILAVKKISETAKKMKIITGPGRGSAVGSFVVNCLGITKVNPLKYDLLFERFLNPYRKELPDIDLDVEAERRDELIKGISNVFGKDKVCQIRTYSTMKTKSVIKKVEELTGLKKSDKIFTPFRDEKNLAIFDKMTEQEKEFYILAYYHENLEMAESVHAAGVIISENPITEKVPVEFKEIMISQWTADELRYLGIDKFDILALETLNFEKKLKIIDNYDNFNNFKVYELLSKGLTCGIFQLDSYLGKKLSLKIKPKNFEQLVILLSINRPGPLETGMVEMYLSGHSPEYLKNLLPETNGVPIFQEQIMIIAQKIGGFSPEQSDILRKALSKKETEIMKKFKDIFVQNAKKIIGDNEAQYLFEQIEKYSKYSFNKSHAIAYAHISYNLMNKKAEEPEKFYMEYIKEKGLSVELLNELLLSGFVPYPPDLRKLDGGTEGKRFILPIKTVRGISEQILVLFRNNNNFKNFDEFIYYCNLNNLNKSVIEMIIKSGAIDYIDSNRKQNLRKSTSLTQGKIRNLYDINDSVFGTKQKSDKDVDTDFEDIIQYEIDSFGYPVSCFSNEKLSKTLINKYFSDKKLIFTGYHINRFLVDFSGIIEVKDFLSKPKMIKNVLI